MLARLALGFVVALEGASCKGAPSAHVGAPGADGGTPAGGTPAVGSVAGAIEAVESAPGGEVFVDGWACDVGSRDGLTVRLVVGAPAEDAVPGTALPDAETVADVAAGPSVAATCRDDGAHHFHARVAAALAARYQDVPVYAYAQRKGAPGNGTRLGVALPVGAAGEEKVARLPLDARLKSRLLPGIPSVITTPSGLLRAIDVAGSGSETAQRAWKAMQSTVARYEANPHERVAPYLGEPGKGYDGSRFLAALVDQANLLWNFAFACAVTGITDSPYCKDGVAILDAWARQRLDPDGGPWTGAPGGGLAEGEVKEVGTEDGLNLARVMHMLGDSYRLLAIRMSADQRRAAETWFGKMGKVIRAAQLFYLSAHTLKNHPQAVGPQNHIAWHDYGIAVTGLLSHDAELTRFALVDPSNPLHFAELVHEGIYRTRRAAPAECHAVNPGMKLVDGNCFPPDLTTANFHAGELQTLSLDFRTKSLPVDLSFGGHVEDGEIWDRMRHVTCGHPAVGEMNAATHARTTPEEASDGPLNKSGCGLSYALFHLRGLVYTAHLAEANGLSGPDRRSLYEQSDGALLEALAFYGQFYAYAQPTPGKEGIPGLPVAANDPKSPLFPYDRETASRSDFSGYVLAAIDLGVGGAPKPRDPAKAPGSVVKRNFRLITDPLHLETLVAAVMLEP